MLKAFSSLLSLQNLVKVKRLPTKQFIEFSRNRIHCPRQMSFKYDLKVPSKVIVESNSSVLSRSYCTLVPDLPDDLDDDNNGLDDMLGDTHEWFANDIMQVKDSLYENLSNEDEMLVKINSCNTEDDLMEAVKNNLENISQQYAVLSVVKLWHWKNTKLRISDEADDQSNGNLILNRVSHYADTMTLDELCVCFMYLTKLSVGMKTDVMKTILERILKIIDNCESSDIPISALSRFTIAVSMGPMYTNFVCQNVLTHALYHLDRITSSKELRLLTICLQNISRLISADTMELFKKKVYQFIEEDKFKGDSKTVFKILEFLSFPFYVHNHFPLIRTLLLLLQDDIHTFNAKELEFVGMITQTHYEPAAIALKVAKCASDLLEKNLTAEMLSCSVQHSNQGKRPKLSKLSKEFLFTSRNPDNTTLLSLFKILRVLKISDTSVCNEYWSKVRREIISNPSQRDILMLNKYCHRYMHFNNNLQGTYRHYPFEKTMVELLLNDLDKGITTYLPTGFAKSASFILSYGHTQYDKYIFPEFIVRKVEAMEEQLKIFDCLQLSRGIQISLQMRFRREIHPELASQIIRLENVFNACMERHLEQPNLSLSDLNIMARSYTNRKSSMKTSIYQKLIRKYETIPHHNVTSRVIRDTTFNLNIAKCSMPRTCNSLNQYIVDNHQFVLGETVQKTLSCFYKLNYQPEDDRIFKYATEIINRDFDTMSGLKVIEACLALAFYKQLPAHLIDRVFNISFMQRLENEIESCYSKAFFPQLVQNSVMQLNRAVCLDYPENGVPWFQQNFIEAQMSKLPLKKGEFHIDVRQALINFTKDENLLKVGHVTPYGYRIDFVLYFDTHKKLLKPPTLNDAVHQINKVAILLLSNDSFCHNDNEHILGKEALKRRHLEMMGFKVIEINYNQWNSMYMTEPGAKIEYVRSLLS